ncbi:hypothetical protein [Aquitalea sp. ASV11]|uniref:hypothetical protein n=1 Tax=Aquitalea sp. ASV11 TaxID=2795103 RepID=UPI0018EB18D7|nr:hypothetical protein [Aquitalea sp. ASV11]
MQSRQTLLTLPILLLAGAMLTGCNSDAPSSSDAQQVAEGIFASCDNMKVKDFERVNGIPQNDGSYLVQVKYTVRLTPPDSISSYMRDTYPKTLAELQAKDKRHDELRAQYTDRLHALEAVEPMATTQELETKYPDLAQLSAQSGELINGPQLNSFVNNTMSMIERNMVDACPKVNPNITMRMVNVPKPLEKFAGDVDIPFNDTYAMIKTDNGWMARQ